MYSSSGGVNTVNSDVTGDSDISDTAYPLLQVQVVITGNSDVTGDSDISDIVTVQLSSSSSSGGGRYM